MARLRLYGLFCAGFLIAQAIGFETVYGDESISLIWPPAGVFAAALTLTRQRHWWVLIPLMIVLDIGYSAVRISPDFGGRDFGILALKLVVNPTTGVLFALIVCRFVEGCDPLRSPRALGAYVLFAVILNVGLVSLIGWAMLGALSEYETLAGWQQWAYSDITGMLAFATPIIVIAHRCNRIRIQLARVAEATVVLTIFTAITVALFAWDEDRGWLRHYQIVLLLPVLAWVIGRFGPVMVTFVASILTLTVLLGMAAGRSPFEHAGRSDFESVLIAQGILVPLNVTLLYISSMLESVRQQYRHQIETEKRFRQLDRMETLGTMAAGVAHDFGNLAMAIQANQTVLRTQLKDPSDAVRKALVGLEEVADGAQAMTRSLMTFAREESSDNAGSGGQAADLNDTIRACISAIRPLLGTRHELVLDLPESEVIVGASRSELQRMLTNLIVNASDASHPETPITIKLSTAGDLMRLEVIDEGEGIPEDIRKRVFDPFFTTKARGKGTGLGLAVVSGVIRQMGGAIDVVTADGHGTRIIITAPIVDRA